jgi:hypothetical protein
MPDSFVHTLGWLQSTPLAIAIANSLYLLAGLSAVHVIGFTLLMGSALVGNLRLAGMVLPMLPIADVVRPARRMIAVGLTLSFATGFLLFATRALNATYNWIFDLKMGLLLCAAIFHFVVPSRFATADIRPSGGARIAGMVGLALWISVALAGCAFIFLE